MNDPRPRHRHSPALRVIRVRLAVHDGELAHYLRMALAADPQWSIAAPSGEADLIVADADEPLTPMHEAAFALRLPILFVGGSNDSRERLAGSAALGVEFLAKPFNAAQLRSALRTLAPS